MNVLLLALAFIILSFALGSGVAWMFNPMGVAPWRVTAQHWAFEHRYHQSQRDRCPLCKEAQS
jgi:hypothetical protein